MMNKEKFIELFDENRLTFLHGSWEGIKWLLDEINEDEREVLLIEGEDNDGITHFLGMWIKRSERLRQILDKYWDCPYIQLTEIFIAPHDESRDGPDATLKCRYDILVVKYDDKSVRKQAEYIWKKKSPPIAKKITS